VAHRKRLYGEGSLIGWLRERKAGVGDSDVVEPSVDLLRRMHHISMGMVYLHSENVLHGDLKVSADG
jgi:hypothetical protein